MIPPRFGAALLVVLAASPAQASGLFISTEHPFAPDAPGAVVKIEVVGARLVDVRLYRVADPERFVGGQKDLAHASPEARQRVPGALSLLRSGIARLGADARQALASGLSPAALAIARSALQAPRMAPDRTLPYLPGLALVERWQVPCGGGDPGFAYCDLDIGPRPAGLYLVEASSKGEVALAVAVLTRLGLVVRRTAGQLVALAVESASGQPVPGASITLLGAREPLKGATGKQGVFVAKVPPRRLRLIAQRGADVALVEVDSPDSVGEPEVQALLVTDRGEYRPGERVRFHGFARSGFPPQPPRLEALTVTALDPRGAVFWRSELELSALGGFGGELEIPPSVPRGLCRLAVQGDASGGAEFSVRDAPTPAFSLSVALEPATAATLQAQVRAGSEDAGLPHIALTWRAFRVALSDSGASPEEVDRGDAETDASGKAAFPVDAATQDARYEVSVVGRDAAGRTVIASASATVSGSAIRPSLTASRRLAAPGTPVELEIRVRNGRGEPVAAETEVRVRSTRAGAAREVEVSRSTVRAGNDGRAGFVFTPSSTGYYEIDARAGGRIAETYVYVTAEGGDIPFTPDALALVPEKESYSAGETARVLVLAPFDAGAALVTLEGDDLARHEVLQVKASSAVWTFKVPAALAPAFRVTASAVAGDRTWQGERTLRVTPGAGHLVVSAGLGPEGVVVEVKDKAGKPVQGAEVFLAVRDERAVGTAAPSLEDFFHPDRAPCGTTESSTTYRNSSAGRRSAAQEGLEGASAFKGPGAGPPRPRDSGTLTAVTRTTDASGRAIAPVVLPADVERVAFQAWAATQDSLGQAEGTARPGSTLVLDVPAFLRDGDGALVSARGQGAATTSQVELEADGGASDRDVGTARLRLQGAGAGRRLHARAGSRSVGWELPVTSSDGSVLIEVAGLAGPGRTPLPGLGTGERAVLWVGDGVVETAAAARRAMGIDPPRTAEEALARVLARLGSLKAGAAPGAEAAVDAAALTGMAHPEGWLGPFDGAAPDVELSAAAVAAIAWSRLAGVEVDDGFISRAASRLSGTKRGGAWAALALALAEEPSPARLGELGSMEAELSSAQLALLVLARLESGDKAGAKAAAARLERNARVAGGVACFAESCLAGAPRSTVEATALAVLALNAVSPRSAVLGPAVRFLAAQRGRADFGADLAGGLAALAVAVAGGGVLPALPAVVESRSGRVATRPGLPVEIEGPEVAVVATGPLSWRMQQRAWPLAGSVRIHRSIRVAGQPEDVTPRTGDRLVVTLSVKADTKTGPAVVEDPFAAGLAPIEQEGDAELFLQVDARGRRLMERERVVFLLSSLPAGETVLSWEAMAKVPGRYAVPPAVVRAGEERGRSAPDALEIAAEDE